MLFWRFLCYKLFFLRFYVHIFAELVKSKCSVLTLVSEIPCNKNDRYYSLQHTLTSTYINTICTEQSAAQLYKSDQWPCSRSLEIKTKTGKKAGWRLLSCRGWKHSFELLKERAYITVLLNPEVYEYMYTYKSNSPKTLRCDFVNASHYHTVLKIDQLRNYCPASL